VASQELSWRQDPVPKMPTGQWRVDRAKTGTVRGSENPKKSILWL